ncbi:MAG: DUF1854 domain-containing protein [Lentisphaeria bacterium]|nr:DUF1854 domain-containing protein [Lentisphaeria bacterium]
MVTDTAAAPATRLAKTGVRRLTPEITTVFEGTFSLLHVGVKGDTLYRGAFAARMFPVRHPDRFISLHYTDAADKEQEIGLIEDLAAFPEEQQALVRQSLGRNYHEKVIQRVYSVRCDFGLLFFDVETQFGREDFVMPWRYDRAEEYGEKGKVLLDSFDNRFVIPNVEALPGPDQQRFTGFIYW